MKPVAICIGTFRRVVLYRRYAIKLPRLTKFADGCWCNRKERRLYGQAKNRILCPVLWSEPLGLFLVMARADDLPDSTMDEKVKQVELLAGFEEESGIEIEDVKLSNLGLLSGRLVVIDYAGLPPRAMAKLNAAEAKIAAPHRRHFRRKSAGASKPRHSRPDAWGISSIVASWIGFVVAMIVGGCIGRELDKE